MAKATNPLDSILSPSDFHTPNPIDGLLQPPRTMVGKVKEALPVLSNVLGGAYNSTANLADFLNSGIRKGISAVSPGFDKTWVGQNIVGHPPMYEPADHGNTYADLGYDLGNIGGQVGLSMAAPESILGRIATQAAIGAGENPESRTVGGLTGGALSGIGEAGRAIGNSLLNKSGKYAATGLANQVGTMADRFNQLTNHNAYEDAGTNYRAHQAREKNAWDQATAMAKEADARLGNTGGFDSEPYKDALTNQLKRLTSQSERQSGLKRANEQAMSLLNDYLTDDYNNFSEAMEHNKALNRDFADNEVTSPQGSATKKPATFNNIKTASKSLRTMIDKNIAANNLSSSLGKAWEEARQATQTKHQIFNELGNKGGEAKASTLGKLLTNQNQYADPSNFVDDYIPKGKGEGTQKMQQFQKVIGNPEKANNYLKMNYFGKAFKGNNLDPSAFVKRYDALSPKQQSFLFNPQEKRVLNTLSTYAKQYPDAFSKNPNSLGWIHHTLGGALGALGAHTMGLPWEAGMMGGYLGQQGADAGLQKLAQHPRLQQYFMNKATGPASRTSRNASTLYKLLMPVPSAVIHSSPGENNNDNR